MKVGLGRPACVAVTLVLTALAAAACSGNGEEARNPAATEIAATPTDCGDAITPEGGELSVQIGGRDREAMVHAPSPIEREMLPVLIGLHGYSSTPADLADYTRLTEKAAGISATDVLWDFFSTLPSPPA